MHHHITEIDMLIRLGLGFAAGAIIGFERSSRNQVAGLRTHILIALGATLLMLLSIWIPQQVGGRIGDPGRIAAQVVSGIGFLGAGAIVRLGNNVKGLTTAASLWLVAAVGLVLGAGMYIAAAAAEVIGLVTLIFLDRLEKRFFPTVRNKVLELRYKSGFSPDIKAAQDILMSFGLQTQSPDVKQNTGKKKKTKVRFLVSIPESLDVAALAKAFKIADHVAKVEIKEKY
ncbi:MAG: MgtC/SapB family protein [Treponema sp.]|nr:MgtC/SapB family protein [Treponema sp.]